MKTAIILHGMPSKEEYFNPDSPSQSNKHWLPWIQRKLILGGVLAQAVEMPEPYEPDYEKWKSVFEQFKIDEDTMLIGHSCGGGFLVRWLSENNVKVNKVALVAPWLEPEKTINSDFFKFEINPQISSNTAGLNVIYSTDDYPDILESIDILKSKLKGAQFQELTGRGRFTFSDMKTEKFPELADFLLK